MKALRRSRFLRHVMLPLTLMAWLSGCHKWSSPGMPLDRALSEREGQQVRLTLSDGSLVRFQSMSLLGDSLVGVTSAGYPRTMALDDVIRFEVRKADALKTALIVVPLVAVIVWPPIWFAMSFREDPAPICS